VFRVSDHSARSDTGRQRPGNEDSYWVSSPLFVLADGMGGAQAGEVASRMAVEVFAGGLPDGPGSHEERLAELVAEANMRVHALAQSDEAHAGMGTTLTAAYVGAEDLALAHVGDSRFYVLRDGELQQLTDDHSLVGELVRRGQISAEEAEDHPQRSIITRALGIEDEVVVDHLTWPVRDGDVFLLCSDGLTGMVSDDRVAEIVNAAPSLRQAAQALIHAANEAGGRDNITVILFRVEELTPGAGGVLSQDTAVGVAAPRAAEVREAAETTGGAAPATATATIAPRAPRPPRDGGGGRTPRRRRPWVGVLKGFTVLAVLLVIIASGAWIASRSVYFVGTNDSGFLTLYQGLPYELPGGLNLYTPQFTSGTPAQALSPRVRQTVTDHKLRSNDDAVDLVRQIERGDLAGQS
jgi:serine/threonine protein phosphatase PrpC